MANNKVVLANGTTLIDLTADTVTADKLIQGYTAHDASGSIITGTASRGVDVPTFTVIWDNNWSAPISATCDKTYAECVNYYQNNYTSLANTIQTDQSHSEEYYDPTVCLGILYDSGGTNSYIGYTVYGGHIPHFDLSVYPNGTVTITYPSVYRQTLNITQNGTITNYSYFYDTIIVNVPNSYTATITRTDGQTVSPFAQVNGTGTEYKRNGDSFYFHSGDTITFFLGSSDYVSRVYVNDEQIHSSSSGGYYTYTPPDCNIALEFYRNTSSETSYVKISYSGGGGGGTYQTKTVTPTTSQQTVTPDSGYDALSSVTVNAMPSGTAGTPTATKGTVSNNSVSVTPSVTNTTGYITGSTKTGTAVTVSASELVSGTKSISANGTGIDVTNYASVNVSVADSTFVVTLSWDDDYFGTNEGAWVPNKTWQEIRDAYTGGKTIVTEINDPTSQAYGYYTNEYGEFRYFVSTYYELDGSKYASYYLSYSNSVVESEVVYNYDTRNATATASDVLSGKTFFGSNGQGTGTVTFVTYYTGSSTPSSSLGSNGDIYLKTV